MQNEPWPGRWTAFSGGAQGACSPRGPALPPLHDVGVTWEPTGEREGPGPWGPGVEEFRVRPCLSCKVWEAGGW